MKGLFLKDLYFMKTYYLIMAVIVLLYGILSMGRYASHGLDVIFTETDMIRISIYTILITSVMTVGIFHIDENDKWLHYINTMPVTRKQYISAKYLTTLSGVTGIFILMALITMFSDSSGQILLYHRNIIITILTASSGMGLIIPAIAFPLMLKFRQFHSRTILIGIGILFGFTTGVLRWSYYLDMPVRSNLSLPASVFLTAVVLYALSWRLSVRMFEKKEL